MSQIRAELLIKGAVQGVGYRYFCSTHARRFNLVGWAKNNPDSSVSSIVEGESRAVEAYIVELKLGPGMSHVSAVNVMYHDATGEFNSFEITY